MWANVIDFRQYCDLLFGFCEHYIAENIGMLFILIGKDYNLDILF